MHRATRLVVFELDQVRYGLPLDAVERVVRIVEITPLPKAPDIVVGVVNVRGRIVPVINLRRRFRLPDKEIALTDQMVIARTPKRPLALVADAVHGIVECPEQDIIGIEEFVPGLQYVEGIAKTRDGLILIHDLDKFLALEEETSLQEAINNA